MNPNADKKTIFQVESVEELHSYFEAIIQSSDDAIITKDLNGIIRSWNNAAQRIFGYSGDEILGKPVAILIPAGQENDGIQIIERVRRGEKIELYETVRQRKDGSLVDVSLTVSPIRDATGNVIGASKIARDITRQREAQELQHYFKAIIDSSDDAILSKDLNGIIRSWNSAAKRIFGYTAEEIIGKSVTILIPPGHENEEPGILSRIRNGETVDHYETIRQRKDGSLVNISLTVSPVRNVHGKIIGASKIARDITHQKRANEALYATKKELARLNDELESRVKQRTESLNAVVSQMEEFSYSVSHDLRSPVRAMKGYASAVLEDYGSLLDARAQDYLKRIIRGGLRMDKLILDLLTYSRIARDKMDFQTISLEGLIRDVVDQYSTMRSPNAKIVVNGRLPDVIGHEPSLMQVISNLLSNAMKFVAPGVMPEVNIHAERNGNSVAIFFADNGIGIDPQYQSRLFGMFERGNNDTRYEGNGIGLAIVKKALDRMGGSVELVPETKTGSVFRIVLLAAHGK